MTEECDAVEGPREIRFLNPVLKPGLNLTVRLGDKWMTALPGDLLVVKKTGDDESLCHVIVAEAITAPFGEIPTDWLLFEHDPSCQVFEGLAVAMKAAYDREIALQEQVTLLFFTHATAAV